MLTVGSLFSGIGGLDLGLERAGMQVKWQCEIDPYCQSVLRHHWPDATLYGDIHELSGDGVERVDLICGGFPCQPVSLAGKGAAQSDPRWLWPEFARVVRALRPRYVLVENVPGLAGRGLSLVLGDLSAMGFDAEWQVVSAASVGAPHIRERIIVVAYARGEQHEGSGNAHKGTSSEGLPQADLLAYASSPGRREDAGSPYGDEVAYAGGGEKEDHLAHRHGEGDESGHASRDVAYATRDVCGQPQASGTIGERAWSSGVGEGAADVADPYGQRQPECGLSEGEGQQGLPDVAGCGGIGSDPRRQGDSRQPEVRADVGYSTCELLDWAGERGSRRGSESSDPGWWIVEPEVGRVAHGIPGRVAQLRALGNAVVPQVSEYVGRLIVDAEERVAA